MIKASGIEIIPTRFPDGTTQVWKLPDELLGNPEVDIDWRFESESEFLWIAQLRTLLMERRVSLFVPYLPYARQDKLIDNENTFALIAFGTLLNSLKLWKVVVLDVHNAYMAGCHINDMESRAPVDFHGSILKKLSPKTIIFPDEGAKRRYPWLHERPHAVFKKKRDPSTGKITGMELLQGRMKKGVALMVDDICDGGATFLKVADSLGDLRGDLDLHLAVTHGIFSKGREILEAAGLTLHTTNSLPKNYDGFPVAL